ncbi:MAG: sulfur oxidation c-type cytochrome SoxX [Usitatibacter sp.]
MKTTKIVALSIASALIASCAAMVGEKDRPSALAVMKASFKASGQAGLDRLDQDEVQRLCSQYNADKPLPRDVAQCIEAAQLQLIKYPADGNYLGDWKEGEKVAQSGVGKQYSDDPRQPSGGNCYACHELTRAEMSFGTIGPSLYNFGKLRGYTPEMRKYAFAKVYNADAFVACSNMPRFGHSDILTEKQIKDVVALLMDPKSPVNQ